MSRRAFLRALASMPAAIALRGSALAQSRGSFQLGWNHPWIAYGHDFGPAWGHDGLSTGGWTHETFVGTRGFTATRIVRDPATGRGSLRITTDLVARDPSRASGEVHLNLIDHWPFPCPTSATPTFVNADGALARYRVRLPSGSAGAPSAPNGLQLLLKARLADGRWTTMYTRWENISPSWEGREVEIATRVSTSEAAYVDPGFDPSRVSLIGIKVGMNAASTSALRDVIHLEELAIESNPALSFDFEEPPFERDVRFVRERISPDFSVVRMFVFGDGRASPRFGTDGSVAGLDERFFNDFDVLVDAADRTGVRLMPVLLDFHWCDEASTVSGVQLGGRADVIVDPAKRQTFLDRALRPVLERYGDRDAIFAWDLINEPEWVIRGMPGSSDEGFDLVRFASMRQFLGACTEYIHRFAPRQQVTIGSARRNWLPLWTDLGLDLYQFHWYDGFQSVDPFPWRPFSELGLDRPCIIGEVPTANTSHSPAEFIRAAMNGGYAGLLLWSYRGRDTASSLCSTRS